MFKKISDLGKTLDKFEQQLISGGLGASCPCPSGTFRCTCPSGYSFCASSIGFCANRCNWDPNPNQ
jgi:hypothetical protein